MLPSFDPGHGAEHRPGIVERRAQPYVQGPAEQLLTQLVGPADQSQRRVQDRHPVAEPFGLLQPVRGEEDRHPALAQRGDQLVDLARRHGVKAGGRLVEEQHRRVVEQRPGQRDPLTQPLGQRPAQITGAVVEIDRPQRPADAPANVVQFVEPGEALKVLQSP